MIILRRWKAVLSWAAVSVLVAKGAMWLANLSPPYIPQWCAVLFLLVGALAGAAYCISTEEQQP